MQAHYLPKSYLNGFVAAHVPHGQEPYVHFYDFREERWRRRAPKKLARIPDYYAIEDASSLKHQDIEHAFSKLEGAMVEHLLPKLVRHENLTVEERVRIAEFVGSLHLRVPVQQDHIAEQIAAIGEHYARTLYAAVRENPDRLVDLKQQIYQETGIELPEDFSVDELNPDDYEITATRNAVLLNGFRALDTIVPLIATMGWCIAEAPHGSCFTTSDAPVYLHSPRPADDVYGVGFAAGDVQVSCPLTQRLAFVASWQNAELEYVHFTEASVAQLNIRSGVGARDMIIAPTDTPTGIESILKMKAR